MKQKGISEPQSSYEPWSSSTSVLITKLPSLWDNLYIITDTYNRRLCLSLAYKLNTDF